ncbi:alpha/beta hydrolase [Asticcacaulis sp. YBE204]|uniref:alpha/beta hydrolase n=1 Tax=Asticcacaulis sp. YBE204 TaxID=1282363 RepID=UPI0003C40B53|nr:alpha/beta fold hydrolase [Asticcacaulis sp. YBE204]ESQ78109.1 hypothetical protein AEYBE204_14795 [Asticcacaulis sp. YBE204]
MTAPAPSPVLLSRRMLTFGLVALAGGCSRLGGDGPDQPGAAFLDSQIPPGLSPEYYPPAGFVWSGFKFDNLPQARYGVAAPPVNPRAHLLILADASYPGEIYFDLAQTALKSGVSVWIFEAPGQGGSGHYLLQDLRVHTPDFTHSIKTAKAFVETVIKPSVAKPLYIFGHGSGALTALELQAQKWPITSLMLYAPWNGDDNAGEWHREDTPADLWGKVAHRWRIANPDLRLTQKSSAWVEQMSKARKALTSVSLDKLNPTLKRPPLLIASLSGDQALCSGRGPCKSEIVADEAALTPVFKAFLN